MGTRFTSQEIEDARLAGFQAARQLERHRLCPHPNGSELFRAWMDGWQLHVPIAGAYQPRFHTKEIQ